MTTNVLNCSPESLTCWLKKFVQASIPVCAGVRWNGRTWQSIACNSNVPQEWLYFFPSCVPCDCFPLVVFGNTSRIIKKKKKSHTILTCLWGKSKSPVVSVVLAIPLLSYVGRTLNTWIMSSRVRNKGDLPKMSLLPLKEMKRSQCLFPSYSARIVWDSWRSLAHTGCISS